MAGDSPHDPPVAVGEATGKRKALLVGRRAGPGRKGAWPLPESALAVRGAGCRLSGRDASGSGRGRGRSLRRRVRIGPGFDPGFARGRSGVVSTSPGAGSVRLPVRHPRPDPLLVHVGGHLLGLGDGSVSDPPLRRVGRGGRGRDTRPHPCQPHPRRGYWRNQRVDPADDGRREPRWIPPTWSTPAASGRRFASTGCRLPQRRWLTVAGSQPAGELPPRIFLLPRWRHGRR